MQLSIRRQYLLSLLEKAWSASVGGLLATTKGFYFAKSDDYLRVVRLDKAIGAVASTNVVSWVDTKEPHKFLIDADKFLKLIRSLTCEDVSLIAEDSQKLLIEAGEYRASWNLFDMTDFPILPSYEENQKIPIPVRDFVIAIDRVRAFTSPEALSVAYKQIYFEDKCCWGSDGYNYQKIQTNISLPGLISIPLIGLDVVKFLKLSGASGFNLSWDDSFLYFSVSSGSDLFICIRSQSEPPSSFIDFFSKMSLDSHKVSHFTFDVNRLKDVVERIAITGSATQKKVMFLIKPSMLSVRGVDEDGNTSQEDLIITLTGDKTERTIGIHYEMFLKALSSVVTPSATLFLEKDHAKLVSVDSTAILSLLKK